MNIYHAMAIFPLQNDTLFNESLPIYYDAEVGIFQTN